MRALIIIHYKSSRMANLRVNISAVCWATHRPRTKVLPIESSFLNDSPRHRSTPDRGVCLILKLLVKLVCWRKRHHILHGNIHLTILANVTDLLFGLRLLSCVKEADALSEDTELRGWVTPVHPPMLFCFVDFVRGIFNGGCRDRVA